MKEKIYSHATIAIVYCASSAEFLFDQYTETYRILDWRGRINLIGGNQSPEDRSPWGIWKREIVEEFCFPALAESGGVTAAPFGERQRIADTLLANARPYQDFLVKIPEVTECRGTARYRRGPIVKLNTVFVTNLDRETVECVRGHLAAGRRLRNEGGSVLTHIDELSHGRTLPASATGLILAAYVRHRRLNMPNPEGISARPVGVPRETLRDYLCDFEYEVPFASHSASR